MAIAPNALDDDAANTAVPAPSGISARSPAASSSAHPGCQRVSRCQASSSSLAHSSRSTASSGAGAIGVVNSRCGSRSSIVTARVRPAAETRWLLAGRKVPGRQRTTSPSAMVSVTCPAGNPVDGSCHCPTVGSVTAPCTTGTAIAHVSPLRTAAAAATACRTPASRQDGILPLTSCNALASRTPTVGYISTSSTTAGARYSASASTFHAWSASRRTPATASNNVLSINRRMLYWPFRRAAVLSASMLPAQTWSNTERGRRSVTSGFSPVTAVPGRRHPVCSAGRSTSSRQSRRSAPAPRNCEVRRAECR